MSGIVKDLTDNFKNNFANCKDCGDIQITATIEARIIGSRSQLAGDEHLAEFVDNGQMPLGNEPMPLNFFTPVSGPPKPRGITQLGGKHILLNAKEAKNMRAGSGDAAEQTFTHEAGHTLGLLHPDQYMFVTDLVGSIFTGTPSQYKWLKGRRFANTPEGIKQAQAAITAYEHYKDNLLISGGNRPADAKALTKAQYFFMLLNRFNANSNNKFFHLNSKGMYE